MIFRRYFIPLVISSAIGMVAYTSSHAGCTYGPDQCKFGWVWREAMPNDHVCVSGAVRKRVNEDNALAPGRRSPNGGPSGPDTCIQGYVWREAYAGDHVCVTLQERQQATNDNNSAASRVGPPCGQLGSICRSQRREVQIYDCPPGTRCVLQLPSKTGGGGGSCRAG